MGTPNSEAGMGRKFRISTEALGPGTSGNLFWGPHFGDLGNVLQKWEGPKLIGQGWRVFLRAQRLKRFKIALRDCNFQARLKFSSEIENFKRAAHQAPIFVGNSQGQDWNFQARLNFSSEIESFKRDQMFSIFGPLGIFWGDALLPTLFYVLRLFLETLPKYSLKQA